MDPVDGATSPRRLALVVAIPTFADSPDATEDDGVSWSPLDFAPGIAEDLARVLQRCGFHATTVTDPAQATAPLLRGHVEHWLSDGAPDDLVVVHVLSHGDVAPTTDSLHIVAADGRRGPRVDDLLRDIQDDDDGRFPAKTLFLLDLCYAGRAARLPWQLRVADGSSRAWVLAAAEGTAFDGRFSLALVRVLTRLADGDLGVDPRLKYVPLDLVARLVRREVAALSKGKSRQQVTGSVVDIAASPEWPFFPNPRYSSTLADRFGDAGLEVAVAAFADQLDPGVDPAHFAARAAGAGPLDDVRPYGFFHGRRSELKTLSEWMDGDGTPGIRIVTGNPGSGKSALLGVLVCAAHPLMREATRPLWQGQQSAPSINPNLAAVHARRRSVDEIVSSLARQLALRAPEDGWTPSDLVNAIDARSREPVIVIDALDEADDPAALVTLLVLPLAAARRLSGEPIARVLVGTRTGDEWPAMDPLRQFAAELGAWINLDAVDTATLADDLREYVDDLLRARAPYNQASRAQFRRRIADAVAQTLTTIRHERRWGEFLVAGLFVHYLLKVKQTPGSDDELDTLIASVPRTLPEVFELDMLADSEERATNRVILTALAFAEGDGLPLSLIQAVAAKISGHAPDPAEVEEALERKRFYLRSNIDVDGTSLFRLFHQGLADYLVGTQPGEVAVTQRAIWASLLATVPEVDDRRRWELAEPYLRRHALGHAVRSERVDALLRDTEFLVHADPSSIFRDGEAARSDRARQTLTAYRANAPRHGRLSPERRRQILALDAARIGAIDLGRRLISGIDNLWEPRWVKGASVDLSLRASLVGHSGGVAQAECVDLRGRPVTVTLGYDNTIRVWDLTSGEPIGDPIVPRKSIGAFHCLNAENRCLAVVGHQDGTVQIWDLATRRAVGREVFTRHSHGLGHVSSVVGPWGHLIVTAGNQDSRLRLWSYRGGTLQTISRPKPADTRDSESTGTRRSRSEAASIATTHARDIADLAIGIVDGRPHVVTCASGDGAVEVYDTQNDELVYRLAATGVSLLATTTIDQVPVLVTVGEAAELQVWDLATGQSRTRPIAAGHSDRVFALALSTLDHRPVAVTYGYDNSIRVLDLETGRRLRKALHVSAADRSAALACAVVNGRTIAVAGGGDASSAFLGVWDLSARRARLDREQTQPQGSVSLFATELFEQRIVVTCSLGGEVSISDLGSGKPQGKPMRRVQFNRSPRTGTTEAPQKIALAEAFVDGRPAAIVGQGGTIQAWDLLTRRSRVAKPRPGTQNVTAVACSTRAGRPIAVGGDEQGGLHIWDLRTMELDPDLDSGHAGPVLAVACGERDGRPIAVSASADGGARMWDLDTGEYTAEFALPHTEAASAVACGDFDGRSIALIGGSNGRLWIWDLDSAECDPEPLPSHQATVTGVALTVIDGRTVAISGGLDGRVCLWDVATRGQIHELALLDPVLCVGVLEDGALIIGCQSQTMVVDPSGAVQRSLTSS